MLSCSNVLRLKSKVNRRILEISCLVNPLPGTEIGIPLFF